MLRSNAGRRHHETLWSAGLAVFLMASTAVPAAARKGPPPPTGVRAVPGAGKHSLEWTPTPSPECAGYHVYRSLNDGGPYVLVGAAVGAGASRFEDTELRNGVWYYYVIRAFNAGGEEGGSSIQAAARADAAAPGARIRSVREGARYAGSGPSSIEGDAVDVVSGLRDIAVAIKRGDTGAWWNGISWVPGPPVYLPVSASGSAYAKRWVLDTRAVAWTQGLAYGIRVRVRDRAGFQLDPADSVTLYVDVPATLSVSVAAAPGAVTVGQPINVSVLIANTGGSQALNVRPRRPRPLGSARVAPAQAPDIGTIPALDPGEFATFSWTYSTTSPGTVSFGVACTGQLPGSGPAAEGGSAPAIVSDPGTSNLVQVKASARLSVTVTPIPVNVREGEPFRVVMKVANTGESRARVTSIALRPAERGLVGSLEGPQPAPPFSLEGGSAIELIWTAVARTAGAAAFNASAAGYDESSGAVADSAWEVSEPIGVASVPDKLRLAATRSQAVVGSTVAITALVSDARGTPVPGATVAFTVLSGKGRLVEAEAVTDETGRGAVELALPGEAGMTTVEGRAGARLASISVESVLPGGAGQVLSRNFFDPSRGETVDVHVYQPRPGRIRVSVYSLGGKFVTTLADRQAAAGTATFTWNGLDGTGQPVANGVYFFSVQVGANLMSRRVIVLKR